MKRIFVFLITSVMILFSFASNGQAATKKFSDVSGESWYYDNVNWAVGEGLIKGYPDGTFKPNNLLTESQFAAVLTRYLESGLTDNVLPKDQSATQYTYLEEKGIILPGHQISTKRNAPTSRITMARALYATLGREGSNNEIIDWMYENKLTTGKGISVDKYIDFGGNDNLFRVHVTAFFQRADEQNLKSKIEESEVVLSERMKEIQAKWDLLKPRYEGALHTTEPLVTSPYRLGEMNASHLKDALNLTNFIRFLAYLPNEVRLNEQFNKEAQAASVVNAANEQISHHPVKPNGMGEELFNLGYLGASTGNLGWGYRSLTDSIQRGYMEDADDRNREHVGHRRWILSPHLQEVGFGIAISANNSPHTAMKVIAPNMWDNPSATYDYIAWPSAGAFPISFFGGKHPWSISLNDSIYNSSRTEELTVKLTRLNDQKTWEFSEQLAGDGFFTISTDGYGQTPYTLIFQPKEIKQYHKADRYQIEVSGIYKTTGEKTAIQFETIFFDLKE